MKANEGQLKKQLTALISAVRPSILWRIDGSTTPLDLLDDDGITGWQIGLGSIVAEFEDPSSNGFSHVIDWIQRDRELEKSRWQSPHVTLTQAQIVFGSTDWQLLADDPAIVDRWASNIDAAFARSPSSLVSPLPSTQKQAAKLCQLLEKTSGTCDIRNQLDFVTNLKPRHETSKHFAEGKGLIGVSDLKKLQSWLNITAANKAGLRFEEHRKRQLAS